MAKLSLKDNIEKKINRSNRNVFLRSDFKKLAGYDQVGRALRELVKEGKIIKVGYGLYAKARTNKITGKPMLAAENGFVQVADESLKRLKIKSQKTLAEKEFQTGISTQIPINATYKPSRDKKPYRFSRKISYRNLKLLKVSE